MAGHPSTPSAAVDRTAIHGPGLTDVRMMIVVHKCFRREIGLGPREIRATPDGDRQRAAQVTDHVELFLGFLHHHHTNEDDLLWDKLLERVPDDSRHWSISWSRSTSGCTTCWSSSRRCWPAGGRRRRRRR